MDIIKFAIIENSIHFTINGRNFLEMVKEVEMPFAQAKKHPDIAGEYTGLCSECVPPPFEHFFEQPNNEMYKGLDGKIALFVCADCGEPGCWPLEAKVTETNTDIVWSDFAQPHRGSKAKSGRWRYDGLGPFRFNKKQYTAALNAALR